MAEWSIAPVLKTAVQSSWNNTFVDYEVITKIFDLVKNEQKHPYLQFFENILASFGKYIIQLEFIECADQFFGSVITEFELRGWGVGGIAKHPPATSPSVPWILLQRGSGNKKKFITAV